MRLDLALFCRLFPAVPAGRQEHYRGAINRACDEFEILTPQRLAAFLAQVGHETGGLQYLEELGGPTYYARYDNRADLGNMYPGDGAKYHGRGLLQITGRANYALAGRVLGIPLELWPELAGDIEVGARVGAWWWRSHGLNELADADDFDAISRKINGGTNGLANRHRLWESARHLLGVSESEGVSQGGANG